MNSLELDIKYTGVWSLFLHMFSKITGNRLPYDFYRQKKFMRMEEDEIKKYLSDLYVIETGDVLSWTDPKTANEKTQWLKIYDSTSKKTTLADKYLVRDYIKEKIGEKYLIPLLGYWEAFDDIDFDKLPDQFVLKANHGSGMNLIIKDKKTFDKKAAKIKFDAWMKLNFAYMGYFEMHYKDIKPLIICEEYIKEMDDNLYDYKFHCFDGVPCFIEVIGDRNVERHTGHEAIYDLDWNLGSFQICDYPLFDRDLPKPDCLDEMISISKILSEGFSYARIDLYCIGQRVKFGEITFTSSSGYQHFNPKSANLEVGNMIKLNKSK